MVSSGYEELEHTADVALKVWGGDFFTLLKQSARGMYELMGVELNRKAPRNSVFQIGPGSREMQLVDFLNEVLYLAEEKTVIFESFSIDGNAQGLEVKAAGFETKIIQRNIKAVTFHDLEIIEKENQLETRITFDV